jgi:small GTP-binding protein
MSFAEIKVVLLGAAGAGKTSIVRRFVKNDFCPDEMSTIGCSFMSKLVLAKDNTPVKCHIWDTAGQEAYASLAPLYYRNAQIAVVAYDITSTKSLRTLKYWINELKNNGPLDVPIIVVGNKMDCAHSREVAASEVIAYVDEINAQYIETSAKENTNIAELFAMITSSIPAAHRCTAGSPEIHALSVGRTWKDYAGRTGGPESYQLGDAIIRPTVHHLGQFGGGACC